jgi:hypothetical protein
VLALLAAPGASAQASVSCLNLATFETVEPTILGTDGRDVLRGTADADVIAGLDGDDVIAGLGGDDVICGGQGNDKVDGGAGGDSILGDTGETFLLGNPAGMEVPGGNDLILGGDGNDGIGGEGGRDLILAGAGGRWPLAWSWSVGGTGGCWRAARATWRRELDRVGVGLRGLACSLEFVCQQVATEPVELGDESQPAGLDKVAQLAPGPLWVMPTSSTIPARTAVDAGGPACPAGPPHLHGMRYAR